MRLIKLGCFALAVLAILSDSGVTAEQPPTVKEALAARGIGITHDELVRALVSSDSYVRGLAAAQLAENKDIGALPKILSAGQNEKNPRTQLNIAHALSWLGDEGDGKAMAVEVCRNSEAEDDLRLQAAADVVDECLRSVIDILASTSVPSMRLAALQTVCSPPRQLDLSDDDRLRFSDGVRVALKDQVPVVREKAATCIAKYRLTALTKELRQAASIETDSHAITQMRLAQEALRR